MDALGRLFDIGTGWVPVDAQSAQTGKRCWIGGASGCTIVVFKAAGTAGDDHSYDLQQHTAASGGTSADLDIVSYYYVKQETTLDNDESWEKFTQTAASEITDAGAAGTSAEQQQILVIEVDAAQLSDGYAWISLNSGGEGSNAQLSACLYLLHGLRYQRTPANLGNLLSPVAADA
jgi:hypothetical protein